MQPSELFCFKDTKTFAALLFFLAACNKKFKLANAKDIAQDHARSTRRLVEDGMSTGLTNTLKARGFSDLYHVFARKQCILCPALRLGCLTLLYVTSIRDFFCPWNNRARLYQTAASQPRAFTRLLVGNQYSNGSMARRLASRFLGLTTKRSCLDCFDHADKYVSTCISHKKLP